MTGCGMRLLDSYCGLRANQPSWHMDIVSSTIGDDSQSISDKCGSERYLGSDLVATLADLNVNDFAHIGRDRDRVGSAG